MGTSTLWDMNAPFPEADKRMGKFASAAGAGFDTGFKPLYPEYIGDKMVYYCPAAPQNKKPDFTDPYALTTYCSDYRPVWGYGLRWGSIGTLQERDRTSNSGNRYIMDESGASSIENEANWTGHLRGANFLFLDSSVQFISTDKYKILDTNVGCQLFPQFKPNTRLPSEDPAKMGIDQFYGKN